MSDVGKKHDVIVDPIRLSHAEEQSDPMNDMFYTFEETKEISATIHVDIESGYWAEVPELPGCVTEGETLDELMSNLKEAAEGWLIADAERNEQDEATKPVITTWNFE